MSTEPKIRRVRIFPSSYDDIPEMLLDEEDTGEAAQDVVVLPDDFEKAMGSPDEAELRFFKNEAGWILTLSSLKDAENPEP